MRITLLVAVLAAATMLRANAADAQESAAGPDGRAPEQSAAPASTEFDELFSSIESPSAPAASEAPETPAAPAAPQAVEAEQTLDTIPLPRQAEALPTVPEPRRAAMLEEIVVTAQRREESAQDVPISMTVLDSRQITNANIVNPSDLAVVAPSLSTNQRFGADSAKFSIRGFNQELRTTASVATYFAEVVAPRGAASQQSGDGSGPGALFDLENVQVLKGPQGTLFGRNTTGGAVLIVPKKPTDEFDGYVEVSGGEFGMFRQQGVVNVPINDDFRIRLSVDRNERDGYLNNITGIGSDKLADMNYISGRLSSVIDLTDSLENYTIVSYVDSDSTGYTARLFACNPNLLEAPFLLLVGNSCSAQLADQAANGQDGFYDVVSTVPTPVTTIKEKRIINTLSWSLSDDITLKNILAYAHLHTDNSSDIFGYRFKAVYDPDPRREFKTGVSVTSPDQPVTSQETWVGELQLQGNSFDSALEWQTGVYYERSLPDGFSGQTSAALLSCDIASLEGDPSGYNCMDVTSGLLGSVLTQRFKINFLNQAAYAQATYHLSNEWSVTGGLRYTIDKARGYGIKQRYTFAGTLPLPVREQVTRPEVSSEAPTGLLEVSFKPAEDILAYAKYVRGYRQGSVVLATDPGVDTFDPEFVDTYEIGAKTTFGGPIPGRFNLAVFYNDFTNQQLQVGFISPTSTTTTAIFNAGKSRIQGVEGEVYLQLLDSLSLSLSFSLLDTELLSQEDHTDDVRQAGGLLAGFFYSPTADVGDELPFAPDQSYVASLNWALPVSERLGEFYVGATYSYIGNQRATASSSSPFGLLDSFDLLNLNLNWRSMFRTPLDLAVFATNALDEEYVTYVSGTYRSIGFESRMAGQPRMVGARLKYNFGAAAH